MNRIHQRAPQLRVGVVQTANTHRLETHDISWGAQVWLKEEVKALASGHDEENQGRLEKAQAH